LIERMPPSRTPLLIVPIRDRRQGRRVLTIKNFAMTMLGVAIVIAAISIYSQKRRGPAAEYGRLSGTEVAAPNRDLARKVDVIQEGPIADQAAADPMLVAPAGREQLLMANSNVAPPPAVTTGGTATSAAVAPVGFAASSNGTTIVGDGKGVALVHAPASSTAPPPPLSGGVFKQQ
jgi:hypothetical protein